MLTFVIIGGIVGLLVGAAAAKYQATKVCPFCGFMGESRMHYPLCQRCSRDRTLG